MPKILLFAFLFFTSCYPTEKRRLTQLDNLFNAAIGNDTLPDFEARYSALNCKELAGLDSLLQDKYEVDMRNRPRFIDDHIGILVIRNNNNLTRLSLIHYGKPYHQLPVEKTKKLWATHGAFLKEQRLKGKSDVIERSWSY